MTAREIGSGLNRMSHRSHRTVASQAATGRKKEKMSAGERRRMGQLVVCAAIFVTIVAARLLLPQRMVQLSDSIRSVMGQSMDVQEVFSAVGRAVTGEESISDSMGDVYQAVFDPEDGTAVETAATAEVGLTEAATLKQRQSGEKHHTETATTAQTPGESRPLSAGEGGGTADAAQSQTPAADSGETAKNGGEISAVTLVYSNLPKNVCMEQQILGFSYTTPVVGVLSSPFGYREHPIKGEEKFHYGVDLAVAEGTTIGSFADGTVTAVGESSSLGKYVIVEHENGYSTLYAHCSKVTISSGASVTRGQKLAEVGQTGLATGPHCHFELHRDSNYLNPIFYVQTA